MQPITHQQRTLARRLAFIIVKTLSVVVALYFFICSLTFLSTSFRILGGRKLSGLFSSSELLSNPIVGLMIGILVTVLVQSSATSTSIIVSLVSAGVEVRHAVPMIFGSNIGTSVTNTIVSMTQAGDRDQFERAFAAATVHDMFNWLAVIVMMIFEVSFGFLEKLTGIMVDNMSLEHDVKSPDLLKPLTKPFTNLIVQVDSSVLLGWSFQDPEYENVTSILEKDCTSTSAPNATCTYLLALLGEDGLGMNDVTLGILLLGFSLAMLCGCLIAMVKILNSVMGAEMAAIVTKTINAEVPGCPWITGYIAMFIGAVITILVRSSSVFTSTLTPLCGLGLVTLETAYPMTLGSNIGTTTTSILASFAAEGRYLKPSIQISLVHLFFNIIGILIFYPIPWLRWPIPLARILGRTTAEYRWFAMVYLLMSFFIIPIVVFLLSWAGPFVLYSVLGPVLIVLLIIILINIVQNKNEQLLPRVLRNWQFLPLWMRSLQPLDDLFSRLPCCAKCRHPAEDIQQRIRTRTFSEMERGGSASEIESLVTSDKSILRKPHNNNSQFHMQEAMRMQEASHGPV